MGDSAYWARFSMFPPEFLTYFRTGGRLGLKWLETVTKRTRHVAKQLPNEAHRGKADSKNRSRMSSVGRGD